MPSPVQVILREILQVPGNENPLPVLVQGLANPFPATGSPTLTLALLRIVREETRKARERWTKHKRLTTREMNWPIRCVRELRHLNLPAGPQNHGDFVPE